MEEQLRHTGIDVVGCIPWGTHFCQFYQDKRDLTEILVPYFQQGLAANEFCVWAAANPLEIGEAMAVLGVAEPQLDEYLRSGQIEFVDSSQWYARTDGRGPEDVLRSWSDKLKVALARGFEGLRLATDTSWLDDAGREAVADFEAGLDAIVRSHRMLALCTCSLDRLAASEALERLSSHQFALDRREDRWQTVECRGYRGTEPTLCERRVRHTETEQQTREFLHQVPTGVYQIDFRTGSFTSANEVMCEMLGYSQEELLALDPFDLLDQHGQARFQARIDQWLGGEEPEGDVEYRIHTRSGEALDTILNVSFTKDAEGRPLGALVVAHDITARKQEERHISRYNAVLQGINQVYERVLQSESEEALGEACLAVALELTGSEYGFIGEIGADGLLHDIAISDMGRERCRMDSSVDHRNPGGDVVLRGLHSRAIAERRSFYTNEPSAHPDSIGIPDGHPSLTSFLGVPLVHEGKVTGTIAVANRLGGYGPEQQEDLEALAPTIVEALSRKRAETQLKGSERRISELLESISDGFVAFDRQWRFVYANRRAGETLGFEPEDLVGRNLWETFPAMQGTPHARYYYEVMESRSPVRFEAVGAISPRSYAISVYPSGEGISVYYQDITVRKRAELKAQQLAEQRQLALDAAKLGWWKYDPTTGISTGDDRYRQIFGVTDFARPNNEILKQLHPDDLPGVRAKVEAALDPDDPQPYAAEYRINLPDGSQRWIEAHCIAQFEGTGKRRHATALVGTVADITERRQTEEQLHDALVRAEAGDRMLSALMEYVPEGITLADKWLNVTEVSLYGQQLLGGAHSGLSLGEVADQWAVYFADGITPMPDEELPLARAIERGEVVEGVELVQISARGESLRLLCSAGPIRDADGNVTGGVVAWRDVTDRRRAEDQLRRYAERVRILHEVDSAIITRQSAADMADAAVRRIQRLLPCVHASVVIYHADTLELSWLASYSQRGGSVPGKGWRVPADDGWAPVLEQLMAGDAFIAEDLQTLPPFSPLIAQLQAEGVRTEIYEPIRAHGRFIGMLGLGLATPGTPSPESREVMHELGVQLAIGLEQARLHEQSQRHAEDLERLVQQRTASLEASEARFRTVFEGAGIGIALATADGVIVATNPALQRMLGYSPQELTGMHFFGLLADPGVADETWLQDLLTEQPTGTTVVARYRRRDGQQGDANATVSWLRQDTEVSPLVLALVEDITERKRAEEALRVANAYNRNLIEASLDPLVTIGPDGKITDVNVATEAATGRSRTELIGTDFSEYFTEPAKARAGYERVFREGSVRDYELDLRHRDGHVTSVLYNASLYRDEKGNVIGAVAAARDVTERRRAQEALVQTEQLAIIGRMAASLAHEINNPIQSVVGCLGLAMESLEEGEDSTELMEVAMEELRRAARIVHRMRDLVRQEKGHKEFVDVAKLIDRIVVLTHNQAQNHQTEIIWEGQEGLPAIFMVSDRIQQVFLNMVLNAIDAMPEGGELRIGAASTSFPPGVQISFADTGVGIPSEELETLFEAFRSTKSQGLGLGLYVSRNIVMEHGGLIDVESQVGEGTTFTVWLPTET